MADGRPFLRPCGVGFLARSTAVLTFLAGIGLAGDKVSLMDDAVLDAIRENVSGSRTKAHIVALSRFHRVQGSEGYHRAAEYVRDRLGELGLSDVRIVALPADGETRYHQFRAYYGWAVEEGTLWEVSPRHERVADFGEMPVALADYSQDAEVTTTLVDVGQGTDDGDYEGTSVRGRIVLAGGPLPQVHRKAVEEREASGILSFFPNQRTGWSGDDPDLVRWGHLDPFNTRNRFAFMIGLRKARELRERLAAGETIRLEAKVRARLTPGSFEVVTGVISGTERAEEEIVFTCHLDHQSPGANDNASGAATLLEVARVLAKLIDDGRIPRPRRSLRFLWPPEIAGTYAFLARHPELRSRMRAGIHMDMVGGIPQTTKSVFFLSRPPASIPSFIGDVGEAFFDYVVETSRRATASGDDGDAILSPEGTKEDFVAEVQGLDLGSDHEVLNAFGIPALYFHDWPDVYIHTHKDSPENMDATKLQRVAFLGATTGYTLAQLGPEQAPALMAESSSRAALRMSTDLARALDGLVRSEGEGLHNAYAEARNRILHAYRREAESLRAAALHTSVLPDSWDPWLEPLAAHREAALAHAEALYRELALASGIGPRRVRDLVPAAPKSAHRIPFRTAEVQPPLEVYYHDYLADHLTEAERAALVGGATGYELLNFADGTRSIEQIRDAVSAELEPISLDVVLAHFDRLEKAGVVSFTP